MDKNKLALTLIEIVAMRLDAHDQRIDGIWPPNTDLDKWKLRYRGTPPEDLPPNMVEINHFKIEVDDFVAALFWAISDAEDAEHAINEKLIKENEALREDAERYRWLRNKPTWEWVKDTFFHCEWHEEDPQSAIDEAIDAARRGDERRQ